MSRNLTDILRAHEGEARPTALDVLKDAMDERSEITDPDRRRAAAVSGLPEATVYGVSTFYDDLVQPRGRRHMSVCTGTAFWASDFGAHVEAVGEPEGESVLEGPVHELRRGTFEALRQARESLTPEELIEQVKEANVRGRGGAGFPAGVKWEFAARAEDPDRSRPSRPCPPRRLGLPC